MHRRHVRGEKRTMTKTTSSVVVGAATTTRLVGGSRKKLLLTKEQEAAIADTITYVIKKNRVTAKPKETRRKQRDNVTSTAKKKKVTRCEERQKKDKFVNHKSRERKLTQLRKPKKTSATSKQVPKTRKVSVKKKSKKPIAKCKQPATKREKMTTRKKNVKEEVKPTKKAAIGVKLKAKVKPPTTILQQVRAARKLHTMWTGPKKHRVASLNALAKVHCLYENESRIATFEQSVIVKKEHKDEERGESVSPQPTRTLRSLPGLRAVGKLWDMHDTTSSSSEEDEEEEEKESKVKPPPSSSKKKKEAMKQPKKPPMRRKRNEIVMDLKDMVVRKRMASLNASAILAASYSVEKRGQGRRDSDTETESEESRSDDEDEEDEEYGGVKVEVKKESAGERNAVAMIVNQDTDVTFTGVYVNSTTRSTHHHEGYCRIAGMQYRISATSHTQTAATAVATETILQSTTTTTTTREENENTDAATSSSSAQVKSYAPLDALSNMQPPANAAPPSTKRLTTTTTAPPATSNSNDLSRRRGCTSAFSAPPPSATMRPDQYVQGYYQPAGPLISVPPPPPPPHGHSSQVSSKSVQLAEPSPTSSSPLHQPPPPSSSVGDSSDSEVVITSVTTAKDPQPASAAVYRLNHHYAPPAHTYPPTYGPYPPQYYPAPPPPHSGPAYPHHDMCYSSFPPPPPHKYMFRRYLPPPPGPPYYPAASPDIYSAQPPPSSTTQQMVTATSSASSGGASGSYQTPTLIEPYAGPLMETYPPPPTHYYQGYGPAQPCYTHSSPGRPLSYINATYPTCPCPMQSCPKNVHTGPLAGDSKRSSITSIAKETVPLPPVALALPLEPASATGPPSPARGSAGMPPPPSPAGAGTYQTAAPQPPPKQETPEPANTAADKRRKARVGKAMVRNTMLLMCQTAAHGQTMLENVKREVESPPEIVESSSSNIKREDVPPPLEVHVETPPPPPPAKELLLLPCQKTVAENVKVKNMKRKRVTENSTTLMDAKRQRTEKPNGSYKDLIKKTANVVRINNGRRKLINECTAGNRAQRAKKGAIVGRRRLKSTAKPLTDSNVQTAKPSSGCVADGNALVDRELIENKEPTCAKLCRTQKVHEAADKLSSVERTIESVVNHAIRTEPKQEKRAKRARARAAASLNASKAVVKVAKKAKTKKDVPKVVAKVPRRSVQQLRWSNGWRWHGEGFDGKVFLNSDESTVTRKCYPSMIHDEGDVIEPRDCVLLKAGQRKNELPFVAKIAALWENPEDGEMMMSLLWYYRPEHTDQGRRPIDQQDEVFASRHKDSNSVACIEDKCYVLTYNEYCRYRKHLRRLEAGVVEDAGPCIPSPELYPRHHRQPPTIMGTSGDLVFFCRKVYDFRQKRIIKNPS